MAEEHFDVVNDQDEVVGQKPRREVHQLGLKHRSVHVLIFNRSGQLFLQKRSRRKDRFPGAWDSSAAGHLEVGESYDAAAIRETGEELGWTPPALPQRWFRLVAGPETEQEFVWVYQCEYDGPFQLNPEEIEDGGWFSPEQINRWMQERPGEFALGFRSIWRIQQTFKARNIHEHTTYTRRHK